MGIKKMFFEFMNDIEKTCNLEGKFFSVPFGDGFKLVNDDGGLSGMAGLLEIDFRARESVPGVASIDSLHGRDFMVECLRYKEGIRSAVQCACGQAGILDFLPDAV